MIGAVALHDRKGELVGFAKMLSDTGGRKELYRPKSLARL